MGSRKLHVPNRILISAARTDNSNYRSGDAAGSRESQSRQVEKLGLLALRAGSRSTQ